MCGGSGTNAACVEMNEWFFSRPPSTKQTPPPMKKKKTHGGRSERASRLFFGCCFHPGNAKQITSVTQHAREDSKGAHEEHEDRVQKKRFRDDMRRRRRRRPGAPRTRGKKQGEKRLPCFFSPLSFFKAPPFPSFSPALCCCKSLRL